MPCSEPGGLSFRMVNSQNCRYGATGNPYIIHEEPLRDQWVGDWCALSGQRTVTPNCTHSAEEKISPQKLIGLTDLTSVTSGFLLSVPSSGFKNPKVFSNLVLDSWTMKMGQIGFPETSVKNYHLQQRSVNVNGQIHVFTSHCFFVSSINFVPLIPVLKTAKANWHLWPSDGTVRLSVALWRVRITKPTIQYFIPPILLLLSNCDIQTWIFSVNFHCIIIQTFGFPRYESNSTNSLVVSCKCFYKICKLLQFIHKTFRKRGNDPFQTSVFKIKWPRKRKTQQRNREIYVMGKTGPIMSAKQQQFQRTFKCLSPYAIRVENQFICRAMTYYRQCGLY